MEQEKINIWGKVGCELPDGSLCYACCVLSRIELENTYVSVIKPENSPCPNLYSRDKESNDYQGCKLQNNGKPGNCLGWHCSMADLNKKMDFIAQGLSLGLVTEAKAITSALKLLREKGGTVNIVGVIKNEVLDKSVLLTKITNSKDLIACDLDET
jgi:hypothetical protein